MSGAPLREMRDAKREAKAKERGIQLAAGSHRNLLRVWRYVG